MPKYLVTSGSHFTPFSYDELAKPIMQMQEAHNAAQDAYDTLSLETNALGQYISENPEDSRARAMYDNYMNKLTTLQDNLWQNGFNAQTRRDLAAARAGYASDITRLSTAIKNRQERSKEYWDARHKNPDLVMGADPGTGGLNDYLDNDNFGKDYYSYSGTSFMNEVGVDAKARASEMKRDPRYMRDPNLAGIITRIERDGFTSGEVQAASAAVRAAISGDTGALSGLDDASSILANVLMSHIDSTGSREALSQGRLSTAEMNRLLDYGTAGLSQAIGKETSRDFEDPYFKQRMELDTYARKQAMAARAKKQEEDLKRMNGHAEDHDIREVSGPDARRTLRRSKLYDTAAKTLLHTRDGREIRNAADASEVVYSGDLRRQYYSLFGFDIGRTPKKGTEASYLQGQAEKDGKVYYTRYNPRANGGNGAIEYSDTGKTGTWQPYPALTDIYKKAVAEYQRTRDSYKGTDIGNLAKIDPDRQYDDYSGNGVSFDTPLTGYRNALMSQPQNASGFYEQAYIAQRGVDNADYVDKLSQKISSGIQFKNKNGELSPARRQDDWRSWRGTSDGLHLMTKYGTIERDPIKRVKDVFTFDDKGNITNIKDVMITPDSILDRNQFGRSGTGYIIVRTSDNKEVAVNTDMLRSKTLVQEFAATRRDILDQMRVINSIPGLTPEQREELLEDKTWELVDDLSARIKYDYGFFLNTQDAPATDSKIIKEE